MKSGSPSSGILRRSVPVTFVDANILFSRVLRDYFLLNEFLPDAKLKSPVSEDVVPRNVDVHPKDRHVLAAALSTDADILLTDNTKDFPAEWMTRKGIDLVQSSAMITRLLADFPREFREAHSLCVELSASKDGETVLSQLEKATSPGTAAKVRRFVRP